MFHFTVNFLPFELVNLEIPTFEGSTVIVIFFVALLYFEVALDVIVIVALPTNFALIVTLPELLTFTDLLLLL